jgi:hypothetical protein
MTREVGRGSQGGWHLKPPSSPLEDRKWHLASARAGVEGVNHSITHPRGGRSERSARPSKASRLLFFEQE